MTPERIAEIRALLAAATPGPWDYDANFQGHRIIQPQFIDKQFSPRIGMVCINNPNFGPDTKLIYKAPTIIAELLAEVERLQSFEPIDWDKELFGDDL